MHAYGLERPIESLRRSAQARLRQHDQNLSVLGANDIVVSHSSFSVAASLQVIDRFREALYSSSSVDLHAPHLQSGLRCHICHASFSDVTDLHRHFTRTHAMFCSPQVVDYEKHAVEGLPECAHCSKKFDCWSSFRKHITQKRCHVRPFDLSIESSVTHAIPAALWRELTSFRKYDDNETLPHSQLTLDDSFAATPCTQAMNLSALRARVAHVVRGENWQDLQQNREACDFLTHHCLRCGRWCTHLREAHPQILIPGIDQMIALQKNHVRSSPCPFCSLSWKQQHGCPILLQTAILQAELTTSSQADTDQGTSAHASAVTGPERPSSFSWNCHLCSQSFGARVQLTAHLQEHQQQLHRYDPKRDSVEGEPACSHCGLLVTSMDALRNHITKGHCKHFDPRKHVPDHAISPDLKAALLGGRLGPYLRKAGARTFLTVQCLCCGRAFPGLRELSRHLQDKHSILWNEALHLGLSLKQVISPA